MNTVIRILVGLFFAIYVITKIVLSYIIEGREKKWDTFSQRLIAKYKANCHKVVCLSFLRQANKDLHTLLSDNWQTHWSPRNSAKLHNSFARNTKNQRKINPIQLCGVLFKHKHPTARARGTRGVVAHLSFIGGQGITLQQFTPLLPVDAYGYRCTVIRKVVYSVYTILPCSHSKKHIYFMYHAYFVRICVAQVMVYTAPHWSFLCDRCAITGFLYTYLRLELVSSSKVQVQLLSDVNEKNVVF